MVLSHPGLASGDSSTRGNFGSKYRFVLLDSAINGGILARPVFGFLVMLCCILLLGGCAVGPDYKRPDTVALDGYKEDVPTKIQEEGGVKWRPASPGVPDASAWWTSFNDPLLNEMMEALGQENQRIQSALANLRMAHAQVREARASFFPALNTNMSRARGNDQHGFAETTYNAQLQANWELDLWGATRRGVESQTAVAREEAANLGAVILSMRAELATNYFQLRTYDELIEYYDETIRAFTRSWQITKDQQEAGIATPADVARSLAQLRAAEAQAVNIALQRKKMEHAIAVLLGKTPAEFSLSPAKLVAVIPDIEAGLPSDLLERRPDIAAAEMQVASANAAIGVAKSAFFPVFSFSASGSFVHNSFSEWFTVPNRIWSVGPALALNLFQGGAMSARTDAAIAAWERTVADYRQTVLHAVSEVEDNLAATRYLQREEMLQTQAYEASRRAEEILQNQYSVGIVGFLDVVLAQEATLDNARALSQTRGARFATAVALIRALGGGWDTSGLHLTGEIEPVKTGEHE